MRTFALLAITIARWARFGGGQFSFHFPNARDQRVARADHGAGRHLREVLLKPLQHPFLFLARALHGAGVGSLSLE